MIAIIAAMSYEVAHLKDVTRRFGGKVAVTVTGVGKDRSQSAVENLLKEPNRPTLILSLGFAGALRDGLRTGDLVIPRKVLLADSDSSVDVNEKYSNMAEDIANERSMSYARTYSITVPNMIRSQPEKNRLAETYHVETVDMEDYWVALAANKTGVPFLSVRSVIDTADQELPSYIEKILLEKEIGHRLMSSLSSMAHPARIRTLISLATQSRRAQKSLETFTDVFLTKVISGGVTTKAKSGIV